MTGIDDREFHKIRPLPTGPRPSIYQLRKPEGSDDIGVFFDECFDLPADGRVLDAGCGPGNYLPALVERVRSAIALDIAHVRAAAIELVPALVGDVQALPFADGTFDAALAMHMLYHVPDIPAGVRELRRVVRPGGVLYAFTNSWRAQWELTELFLTNGGDNDKAFGDERFCNENGEALLRTGFDDVSLVELTDTWLEVPDVECIVDELQSQRYMLELNLASGVAWDDMIAGARRDAQSVIDRDGAFRMSENHGLFTCR